LITSERWQYVSVSLEFIHHELWMDIQKKG